MWRMNHELALAGSRGGAGCDLRTRTEDKVMAGIEGPLGRGEVRVFVVGGHLGSVAVCVEEPGVETRAGGLWTQLHWDSRLRKLYSAGHLFILALRPRPELGS